MEKRISRHTANMLIARVMALRGTCSRLSVGAVATKQGRIIATGYNGPPKGLPHCSEHTCDSGKPCTRAVHAEANLIAFAARNGVSLEGSILYITASPCLKCAELIIQAGIEEVRYLEEFRDPAGINLLHQASITTSQHFTTSDEEHAILHNDLRV